MTRTALEKVNGTVLRGELARRPGALDARLDEMVATETPSAFLVVVAGDYAGRVYPLAKNTIVMGRAPDADVRLPDRTVSAQHARLLNGAHGFELEDLSSSNGTFLRGERVARATLRHGDRFLIGDVEVTFLVDREVEPTMALGASNPPNFAAFGVSPMRPRQAVDHANRDDERPSLRDMVRKGISVLRFLRHHAAVVGLLVGVGAGVGLGTAFVLPAPVSATVELKLVPEGKVNPIDGERHASPDETPQFFAHAERAFASTDLVRASLVKVGPGTPTPELVAAVSSRLKFEPLGDNTYAGTYKDTVFRSTRVDPVALLSAHVSNYVQGEIEKTLKVLTAEAEFLGNQVKATEKELSRISGELVTFRRANAGVLLEQPGEGQMSYVALETRRAELTSRLLRLQGEMDSSRRQLDSEGVLTHGKIQASQTDRDALAALNRKLAEARARGLGEAHSEIRQLTEEKKSLEAIVNQQVQAESTALERRANPAHQQLQGTVESLAAQLRATRVELADTERNVGRARRAATDMPRVDARLQELTRAQDGAQRVHAQLFEKLKKVELQLALERVSVSSRYETAPPQLQQPRMAKTALMRTALGVLVALVVAAAVVALRETRRVVSEVLSDEDSGPRRRLVDA